MGGELETAARQHVAACFCFSVFLEQYVTDNRDPFGKALLMQPAGSHTSYVDNRDPFGKALRSFGQHIHALTSVFVCLCVSPCE